MTLRLAIPSDGALHEPTLAFLRSCGAPVLRTNVRRYTAAIAALPGVTVLFQRAADITLEVEEGRVDMGIVGRDRFDEVRREGGDATTIIEALGYGHCELTLAAPDAWVDVTSLADLADLAMEFREAGSQLRIATKYPRIVSRFLLRNGVSYFSLVASSGTLEAMPSMGGADLIADITSTGTTMRENRLKALHGGAVMASQACLIGNPRVLAADAEKLALADALAELVEGYLRSGGYYSVTANMRGESADEVAGCLLGHADVSGLRGPTISRVHTRDGEGWYAVTIVVAKDRLLQAVSLLRRVGGSGVTVFRPDYVFDSESLAHARLRTRGGGEAGA